MFVRYEYRRSYMFSVQGRIPFVDDVSALEHVDLLHVFPD